jgi:mannose-6-phosphate isomerase-like protein (cupin superfamily)
MAGILEQPLVRLRLARYRTGPSKGRQIYAEATGRNVTLTQLAGSFFVACPDLHTNNLRNNWEVSVQNYDIRYDDKYGQLAQIDVAAEGEGYEPWVNQTLTSVNGCVVRLAVIEGELVDWHSHDHEDEFFLVLEGRLELEVEGREPFLLGVHQGVTIPRGVVHRPRAHGRTVLLMVEPATVIPTGND